MDGGQGGTMEVMEASSCTLEVNIRQSVRLTASLIASPPEDWGVVTDIRTIYAADANINIA
jgi:hypothetical protein